MTGSQTRVPRFRQQAGFKSGLDNPWLVLLGGQSIGPQSGMSNLREGDMVEARGVF